MLLFSSTIFLASLVIAQGPKRSFTAESREPTSLVKRQTSIEKPDEVTLLLGGDVMLGRTVMLESLKLDEPEYPFLEVSERLRDSDIVFVNLENPIIEDCPPHSTGFKFCASPRMLEGLIFAGVDVVNLANNHAADYGGEGLRQSVDLLNSRRILTTGLNELIVLERESITFGFLGVDLTIRDLNDEDLAIIRESDAKVDVLVVGVHWGVEYTDKPLDVQRWWAGQMVEAGADVVAGHHPHWIQSKDCFYQQQMGVNLKSPDGWKLEIPCPLGSKPVYYSLGNFVFDQMWSEETRKGAVVELKFTDGQMTGQRILKTYMKNWAQPEFAEN